MENIRSAFDAWKSNPARSALIRLLEASQHLVFGVCHEVLRHRQDSEDATQRVLLEIQKGIDEVADADHFLRRLRLVAFRTALDTRRDRRRRVDRERKAADMNPPPPLPDEVREAIHEAMSALDEESRALVIEHYFEKATLDEIGARRGVSAAAIWERIEAIKGKLRHGLALAGLAAAASKAEACLESATLVAPSVNLVTVATIGGGVMAAKTSTAAVAAIVAGVTFALGLGGGIAIQAARNEQEPPKALKALEVRRNPQERLMVSDPTRTPIPASAPMPGDASAEDAEARLVLAEEIWAQFKRPRFWKDREAQEDTLPKLKRLRPDLTGFFIERYREPELTQEQKASAIHLAMMCGGQSAADLLFELIQVPYSEETKKLRWASIAALSAVRDDYTPAPKDFPVSASLWSSAMTLLTSKGGWDRVLAVSVLSLGKRDEWMPVLSNTARTDSSGLVRSETIYLLSLRGDASALAFLRDQRGAITDVPPESNPPVERHRQMLERIIDEAIEKLERRLKN